MSVLKSNVYGYGLYEICRILQKVKPDLVVVDSYPDYQIVRDNLMSYILIIGGIHYSIYSKLEFKCVVFVVYEIDTL